MRRRRKRADGTYSDSESYHSDQDAEGKKRRQARRAERKTKAIKVSYIAFWLPCIFSHRSHGMHLIRS